MGIKKVNMEVMVRFPSIYFDLMMEKYKNIKPKETIKVTRVILNCIFLSLNKNTQIKEAIAIATVKIMSGIVVFPFNSENTF